MPEGEEYAPAEDTFFLADGINNEQEGRRALDIGSGSGYITRLLQDRFSLAVGTDINFGVLSGQTSYRTPHLVCCHGASALGVRFDLVTCNLPYLATGTITDIATDGGRGGLEVARKIIDTVPACLDPGGIFLFVTSSLSDYADLIRYCETAAGMSASIAAKKRLFFEDLILVRARLLPA